GAHRRPSGGRGVGRGGPGTNVPSSQAGVVRVFSGWGAAARFWVAWGGGAGFFLAFGGGGGAGAGGPPGGVGGRAPRRAGGGAGERGLGRARALRPCLRGVDARGPNRNTRPRLAIARGRHARRRFHRNLVLSRGPCPPRLRRLVACGAGPTRSPGGLQLLRSI